MPQFTLDIPQSPGPPASPSISPATSSTPGGSFGGHLERASRDGSDGRSALPARATAGDDSSRDGAPGAAKSDPKSSGAQAADSSNTSGSTAKTGADGQSRGGDGQPTASSPLPSNNRSKKPAEDIPVVARPPAASPDVITRAVATSGSTLGGPGDSTQQAASSSASTPGSAANQTDASTLAARQAAKTQSTATPVSIDSTAAPSPATAAGSPTPDTSNSSGQATGDSKQTPSQQLPVASSVVNVAPSLATVESSTDPSALPSSKSTSSDSQDNGHIQASGATQAPNVRSPRSAKGSSDLVPTLNGESIAVAAATTAFAAPQDPSADSSHSVNRHQDQGSPTAIAATSSKLTDRPSDQAPAVAAAPNTGPADQGSPQVSGQSAAASDAGTGQVDRVRFLQRVAGAFRAADEQGGQIRLRLSPPELGSMKLELNVRDGLMTAHVQAETDTARNLLLDHLPQLRERLADHNIKIDHFDVELMNKSKSGTPQNFAGGRDANSPFVQQSSRRTPTAAAAAAGAASAPPRASNGRLDVTV